MIDEPRFQANSHAQRFTLLLQKYVQETLYTTFTCSLNVDWNPRRTRSKGGVYANGPGISIAMHHTALVYNNADTVYRFYEYPSYDAHAVIGGFYSCNWVHKLEAVIAHEVAHAVQFFEYAKLGIRCKSHGAVFKKHYATFRTHFVNAQLPEQAPLAAEYAAIINNINR